ADLPAWMSDNFPPPDPRQQRIARHATVVSVSSENKGEEGAKAVDGFPDTIWHSRWQGDQVPGYPHEIVVDLGETMKVKGITILPRQDGVNGWISRYEVFVSEDGREWGDAVARGTFEQTKDRKRVDFESPTECRFVRFVALEGFDGQVWASMAELDVIPAP
ncbi:MAG: discoidin domain-containing protein, partial [Armatimonadota bacterium]